MSDIRRANLVKSFYLSHEGIEPKVIDNNSTIEEKLNELRMAAPQYYAEPDPGYGYEEPVFSDGLDAQTLDALVGDSIEYDENGEPVSNVIKADGYPADELMADQDPMGYAPEPAMPAYDGPSSEELIAQAQAEIEDMKAAAMEEIELQKTMGYQEGRASGYEEGKLEAQNEMVQLRNEIEQERAMLQNQYEKLESDLEPRFVHTLTSIYEKIFEVDLSGHKELIMGLLRNAMSHADSGSKNYLIHVSRDDHEYVSQNRDQLLTGSVAEDAVIDIIEDAMLSAGECMIETPNGIFDCSLGTELKALRKKLELLSYTPD